MRKPGERKIQILQTLAGMLETPQAEKITTAALAARVEVSEAALYRHFASKAQMYEGLIEFIEQTLFGLINRILADEHARHAAVLLREAEQQLEHGLRLQARVNQLLERVEASLKQSLRIAVSQGEVASALEPAAAANLLLCWVLGRWQLFVKSGFRQPPMQRWDSQWALLRQGLGAAA